MTFLKQYTETQTWYEHEHNLIHNVISVISGLIMPDGINTKNELLLFFKYLYSWITRKHYLGAYTGINGYVCALNCV